MRASMQRTREENGRTQQEGKYASNCGVVTCFEYVSQYANTVKEKCKTISEQVYERLGYRDKFRECGQICTRSEMDEMKNGGKHVSVWNAWAGQEISGQLCERD